MITNRLSYTERAKLCHNALAKKIFCLMDDKQSNLAVSADVAHGDKLLAIADKLGPEICVLKTHIDIVQDFSVELIHELQRLAEKHQFFIFEDRKFADIGHTVKNQYQGGIYHIAEWAHIINAHSLPGPGIVKALAEGSLKKERGLLLLAEMSSEGNLLDPIYAQKTLEMAQQFPEFVIGFIAQRRLDDDMHWLYMTPGVRFAEGKDTLGQQYTTPERAIVDHGADVIIVGRGIINADDPLKAARSYREAGWRAYRKVVI